MDAGNRDLGEACLQAAEVVLNFGGAPVLGAEGERGDADLSLLAPMAVGGAKSEAGVVVVHSV